MIRNWLKPGIPLLGLAGFWLWACSASPTLPPGPTRAAPPLTSTASPSPTVTASPSPTATATIPALTATPGASVCSPFAGLSLQSLNEMVFTPFDPPPRGSDDPHQGVDFAERDARYGTALEGLPVQAVLAGRVAAVIVDRFPYGNAVLVEASLDGLPAAWLAALEIPATVPPLETRSALTCPPKLEGEQSRLQSIYLLYAHLQQPPSLAMGDPVACGQTLGAIGNTGNSLNPHLHLELRVGPAGASFASMAHYDASASQEEMANYCQWRVGGAFVALDPLKLLAQLP